jgi:hypothetical protein
MSAGRKGAVVVALAAAFAAPAASAAAVPATPGAVTAAAKKGCKNGTIARIAGKRTCLAAGKRCQRSRQRAYKRNGYTCKRRVSGAYRLKKVKQEF